MSLASTNIVGLTLNKMSVLMTLGAGTVLATEISDPAAVPWASLGVGGVMAFTIFYFYRKQVQEYADREKANADAYRVQAALMIVTLQENSKVTAQLSGAVSDLRTVVSDSSREQRERYEQDLRDAGGRRSYDPSMPHEKR